MNRAGLFIIQMEASGDNRNTEYKTKSTRTRHKMGGWYTAQNDSALFLVLFINLILCNSKKTFHYGDGRRFQNYTE